MTDRDALHKAILANPFDDTPRLVYADCLDEHGEHDRAEFIRVGCELATLPKYEQDFLSCTSCDGDGLSEPPPYHRICRACKGTGKKDHKKYTRVKTLLARSAELLKAHERTWRGGAKCEQCGGRGKGFRTFESEWKTVESTCPDCRGTGFACWPMVYEPSIVVGYSPPSNGEDSPFAIACTWSRGFISGMTSSWSTWTDHSDQILKSHPITDVTITSPKPKKILSNFIAVEGVSGYYHRLPGRSRWWSHWDLHIPGLAEVTEDLLLRAEWPHITFQFQPPEPH